MNDNDVLIVTRHSGLVEWLRQHGITGRVVEQANAETVRGKRVYGVLPLHLAAEAAEVVVVDMPRLPREKRGVDLSPEEMDEYGAIMTAYVVIRS